MPDYSIIKKYCIKAILITFLSILIFSYFTPILAYYIAFFSGVIFIFALRTTYIKLGLLKLTSFGKLLFLILLIIPFYIALYIFFSKTFAYFSIFIALSMGTIFFYIILGLYTIKTYPKDSIIKIIIYSVFIPSLVSYVSYLIDNGSGLYPILGLISSLIWQISSSIILSDAEFYSKI